MYIKLRFERSSFISRQRKLKKIKFENFVKKNFSDKVCWFKTS